MLVAPLINFLGTLVEFCLFRLVFRFRLVGKLLGFVMTIEANAPEQTYLAVASSAEKLCNITVAISVFMTDCAAKHRQTTKDVMIF